MANTDKDLALALQLQDQLFTEDGDQKQTFKKCTQPLSLVDADWELTDPNPDIRGLFLQFNNDFFWGRLAGIEVKWSPRMTSCAGICCYEGRGGLCSVRLSLPLLKLRPRKDLVETLLHEMIHAYLFVTDNNKDHDGHGPEFHKHMYRINKSTGTNITVYHSFHDEVAVYKQHWWRCDGLCRSRQPYYGYVKRSMNRAPSKNDTWFAEHQRTCGGSYTKVKEPEGYGKKAEKKKDALLKSKDKEQNKGNDSKTGVTNVDIRIFGGAGKTLGSSKSQNRDQSKQTGSMTKTGETSFHGKPRPVFAVTSNNVNRMNTLDTQKRHTDKPVHNAPTATVTNTHKPTATSSRGLTKPSDAQRKVDSHSSEAQSSFHLSDFSDSDDDILGSLSLDSPGSLGDRKKPIRSKTVGIDVKYTSDFTSQNQNHTIDGMDSKHDTDVRDKLRRVWGEKKLGKHTLLPLSCKTDFSIANSIPLTKKRSFPDLDESEHSRKKQKFFDKTGDRRVIPDESKRRSTSTTTSISNINENVPLSRLIKKSGDKTPFSEQYSASSKFRKISDSHDLADSVPVMNSSIPQTSKTKQTSLVTSPIENMFNNIRESSRGSAAVVNETTVQENKQTKVPSNGFSVRDVESISIEVQTSVCPVCNKKVPLQTINDHLDLCLTLSIL